MALGITHTNREESEDKCRFKGLKDECWINPGEQIEALTLHLLKDISSLKKDIRWWQNLGGKVGS